MCHRRRRSRRLAGGWLAFRPEVIWGRRGLTAPSIRKGFALESQSMTKIAFDLPDKLANELDRAGLLAPVELERVLREELREQRLKRLDELLDLAAKDPSPPMTPDEIQAEINAYRAEKRRAAGS
jgi:hypothetical protein